MLSNKDDMALIRELIETDLRTRFAMRIRCRDQGHSYEHITTLAPNGTVFSERDVCKWCGEHKE